MPSRNREPKTGTPESKLRSKPPRKRATVGSSPRSKSSSKAKAGGAGKKKAAKSSKAKTGGTGPPLLPFAVSVALLAVTVWLFTASLMEIPIPGTQKAMNRDTYGYLVGSFLSTLSLAVFLRSDGQARATMRYSDWKLLSPRAIVPWITGVSWALGATHLFFWAAELTRPVQ